MVTDTQAAYVMALVRERHVAVKQAFDDLLNAFAKGDQNHIIEANERLRSALRQLAGVVAAEHHPAWLQDLSANAERYATRHSNGMATWRAHLNSALRNAQALENESWAFTDEREILFDIDAIVEKARQDHNIDALYGRVIDTLEALLESGEIDSIKAAADMQRLIATLQQAKSGSFSSQIFSWEFARRLVPNIIAAYVRRNDITGPLLEAYEQTAQELNISLDAAKDQVGEGTLAAAADVLRTDTRLAIECDTTRFLSPAKVKENGSILPSGTALITKGK